MSPIFRRLSGVLVFALLALSSPVRASDGGEDGVPRLGLTGTIPIYWGEAEDIAAQLGGDVEPHWARAQIEAGYRLRPLDTLAAADLAGLDMLLLAQPRALTPAENVALDAWVRGGGLLLLFADPMLTGESRFAIGDRRRPQDVIVLSPILDHWGLRLEFDFDQDAGFSTVTAGETALPVNLPGRFASAGGDCAIEAESILARCRIGEGRALIVADAGLLDLHHPHPDAPRALAWLLEQAFRAE